MFTFFLKAFRDFKVRADAYKAEHGSYFANFERTSVDLDRDRQRRRHLDDQFKSRHASFRHDD